jgi:hypothetical protein
MQHAPAVSFPLGRSRFLAACLIALWMAGALLTIIWCWQQSHWRWPQFLGLSSVLAAGVLARRWWRLQCLGALRWDGAQWTLDEQGASSTGQVSVLLDLQQHLWLGLRREAPLAQVWLWLEQGSDPARWSDLRRAVYSPARSPDAEPEATAPP